MVAQQRHAQDVCVLVLQRAEVVVVDLTVRKEDGLVGRDQSFQALLAVASWRVPVDGLDRRGVKSLHIGLGQVEGFQDKPADLA